MNEKTLLSLAFGSAFPGGERAVAFSELEGLAPKFKEGDAWLRKNAAEGQEGFGWMELPKRNVDDIQTLARWLATRESIVQVGIGGSALGNLMLHNALLPPYWNELPNAKRNAPRFFMSDNVDPLDNRAIWDLIDPRNTAVIVVSKSGSTAETAANFLFFWEKLRDTLGEAGARERVIVVTDKEKGILRPFVDETGCKSLILPEDVGGRFSVLSCVGLLSSWALGIDCKALLAGAGAMDDFLAKTSSVPANPAWILAGLNWLHTKKNRNVNVLMSYSDSMERFGEWFAQLWGESLGKDGQGSTPVRALGTIDQHSQIQLYSSGPDDKFYTILTVKQGQKDIALPAAPEKAFEKLSYLYGKSMDDLRNYEAFATAATLAKMSRPVVTLTLPVLDAWHLGGLIQFYEYVTAMTGYLMEVNAFDQPGVEQGKNYTYGLMGRSGYDAQAQEVQTLSNKISERLAVASV
ncbi:MAG: glucose-6-phosphate isomerase [Synergistaceae bacterium]|nr:glucose-6-phosphate isomerase [Synergistaceae bacterium]